MPRVGHAQRLGSAAALAQAVVIMFIWGVVKPRLLASQNEEPLSSCCGPSFLFEGFARRLAGRMWVSRTKFDVEDPNSVYCERGATGRWGSKESPKQARPQTPIQRRGPRAWSPRPGKGKGRGRAKEKGKSPPPLNSGRFRRS